MVWQVFQLGYRFYFQENSYNGFIRDKIHKTTGTLCLMEDPTRYPDSVTCPIDQRHVVVPIGETDLLLAFILHDDNDTVIEYRHSIELVRLINSKNP